MEDETRAGELEQMTALCERLGAPRAQASVMAAQLLKRAGQLAAERSISRTDALAYLIDVMVRGRNGEPPPTSVGGALRT